jgi:hypothetical protein
MLTRLQCALKAKRTQSLKNNLQLNLRLEKDFSVNLLFCCVSLITCIYMDKNL